MTLKPRNVTSHKETKRQEERELTMSSLRKCIKRTSQKTHVISISKDQPLLMTLLHSNQSTNLLPARSPMWLSRLKLGS